MKIQKQFVDTRFGFPVVLLNVPMVKVRGTWVPKVNYADLSVEVLKQLMERKTRLTGQEIRFIRLHFQMTLQAFATTFYVTHPAVMKWERAGAEPTKMDWATEKDIRVFICSKLSEQMMPKTYAALAKKPKDGGRVVKPRVLCGKL